MRLMITTEESEKPGLQIARGESMTKELIENIRVIIVPCMAYYLRQINYKNRGEIDAEQFSEDMNEILDLATKALEQQPCEDTISRQAAIDAT